MKYVLIIMACLSIVVPASAAVIHVDSGATGGNDGANWMNAYTSLSTAVARASSGDEVWVAEGTYRGPIALKSGVALIGGFDGTETSASESDPDVHRTYISGAGATRAIIGEGVDATAVVRGFWITNGFSEFPDTGSGAYLRQSDAMFVQCVFSANRANVLGGGAAIWGGSPAFVNCTFTQNDGGQGAGGVLILKRATPSFVNCLFDRNRAGEAGAVAVITGVPTFTNCTFANNVARIGKGGALFDSLGESVVRNCILWGNSSPIAGTEVIHNYAEAGRRSEVGHSAITGGWLGDGNLGADPRFVDEASGDYRLRSDSPCRNTGSNARLPQDVADLSNDGNRTEILPRDLVLRGRVEGTSVDMGAFEWHP